MKILRAASSLLTTLTLLSAASVVDAVDTTLKPNAWFVPGQVWSVQWPDGTIDKITVPEDSQPDQKLPKGITILTDIGEVDGVFMASTFTSFVGVAKFDSITIQHAKMEDDSVSYICYKYIEKSDKLGENMIGVFAKSGSLDDLNKYGKSGNLDGLLTCTMKLIQ